MPSERWEGGPTVATALLVALAAALVASTATPMRSGASAAPVALRSIRIDINSAGVAELCLLPEVGPALARAIVADRAAHGPFRSVEEIDRVRGVGPATMRSLAPFVTVGSPGADDHGGR